MIPTYHTIAADEHNLIHRAQRGDEPALVTLLQAHDPFIRKMAGHYARVDGFEFDDALQEARFGFVHGIRRFNLRRRTRLLTYAAWWAKHYLRRALQNTVGDVRLPVWQQDKKGRRVIRAVRLDAPTQGHDGACDLTLKDLLVANTQAADDAAQEKRRQAAIRAAINETLKMLDARELEIARRRMSQHRRDQATLAELGRRLGVSRERVRQIEKVVAVKLRLKLAKMGGRELVAA